MICENCKIETTEREATLAEPYQYKLSGLNNVYLAGINVHECLKCHDLSPIIPRIGELHRLICKTLVKKAVPLTGNEVRFLRKSTDLSSKEFASLLKVSPEHLSRIENSATQTLGAQADKLTRAIIIAKSAGDVTNFLLETGDVKSDRGPKKQFQLEHKHWKEAA